MKPWSVEAWVAIIEALGSYAWPIVVLVGLFLFKSPLKDSIDRLIEFSKDGVKFSSSGQSKTEMKKPLEEASEAEFSQWQKSLGPWLNPILETSKTITDKARLEDELIVGLALAQRRAEFLDIWRRMYSSQAELLIQLARNRELSEKSIEEFYLDHKKRAEDFSSSLLDWIGYLTFYNLAEGNEKGLKLTVYGTDFVQFFDEQNLSLKDRPF